MSQMPPPQYTPPLNYQTPVPAAGGSGLAIAALVCGLVGLCLFPIGLVGIVLGIVALATRKSPQQPGKGMAIGGIVAGAVGPLLAIAILLPSLNAARGAANRIKSSSNMRQIGLGMKMYANENGRGMPFPPTLAALAATQDLTPDVFVAPNGKETPAAPGPDGQWAPLIIPGGPNCSYLYPYRADFNDNMPFNTVVLYEPLSVNNGEGANVLYADGSVEWLSGPGAQSTITQIESGVNPPK